MAEHDDPPGVVLLLGAGVASFAIALLHLGVIVAGALAYRYFGAGETLAQLAEGGSLAPAGLTVAVALVFRVFAAYAWSGAGRLRRLPLLRTGLIGISSVFLLRGISAIPEAAALIMNPEALPPRYVVFSLVSFVVGACYALGTRAGWSRLSPPRRAAYEPDAAHERDARVGRSSGRESRRGSPHRTIELQASSVSPCAAP